MLKTEINDICNIADTPRVPFLKSMDQPEGRGRSLGVVGKLSLRALLLMYDPNYIIVTLFSWYHLTKAPLVEAQSFIRDILAMSAMLQLQSLAKNPFL